MKLVLGYAAMISLTIAGNLLLKTGANAAAASSGLLWNLLNWRVFAGLASWAVGAFVYLLILTRLPLNVANSFAALQFIGVAMASVIVLGESVGALRWLGIALIFAGVVLVGKSLP